MSNVAVRIALDARDAGLDRFLACQRWKQLPVSNRGERRSIRRNARRQQPFDLSHQSLLDNRADAAMASQAITKVVDAARTGTRLG